MTLDRGRVMLIGAAVLTILAWGYKLWPSGSAPSRPAVVPAAAGAAQPTAPPVTPVTPPPPPLSAAALSTWVGLHRSARDPFFTVAEIDAMNRPPPIVPHPTGPVAVVAPPPPLPAYTVSVIMTAGSERVASIDDRVVRVGDMIGTERVAQILPDAVVLERGGERRRLPLSGDESARGLIHIERVR